VGKAKEVPSAIRKGIEAAKKGLRKVNVLETTIPHQVLGQFASSQVLLKPAPEGTGVIAGGAVRAVISACGIPNVLTKSIGRRNPHNVVKATIVALESLREKGAVAEMRGLTVEKL
jgi:small subunit ribosomal protein S5